MYLCNINIFFIFLGTPIHLYRPFLFVSLLKIFSLITNQKQSLILIYVIYLKVQTNKMICMFFQMHGPCRSERCLPLCIMVKKKKLSCFYSLKETSYEECHCILKEDRCYCTSVLDTSLCKPVF